MPRNDWMLPSEDAIERSLTQQPAGRTAGGGRKTKRALALLVCAAAALTLLLGAVLSPMGDLGGSGAPEPETPGRTTETPPGNPFGVYGYTYAAGGTVAEPYCTVNITNVDTGYWWVITSSASGFYSIGIFGFVGDTILVKAYKGEMWGETSAVATGVSLRIDVTLNQVIPEFPTALIPVAVMLSLVAVAGIRRRRNIQP